MLEAGKGGENMLRLAAGTVIRVKEKRSGLQVLEIRMEESGRIERALSFSHEEYIEGEQLILNTTAVRLQLGTGGYHLVLGKAEVREEQDVSPNDWGHVMKMRYAPWQLAVDAVEEQASPYHHQFLREDLSLEGTPVLIGELHSLLPVAATVLKEADPTGKIVYVMPDGASLPVALSRHVQHLKSTGMVDATVTAGHAWGGDHEAVTIHSGLLAARHVEGADVILCMLGPGVAGTGTPYAFSGLQLAEVIHAVSVLGGVPFFIPRISFADPRRRHYGISHHTNAILGRFALCPVMLIMPLLGDDRQTLLSRQIDILNERQRHVVVWGKAPKEERLALLESVYGLSFTTMGRSWQEDPVPFQTAVLAADMVFASRAFDSGTITGDPNGFGVPNILAALGLFLTRNEVRP